MAVDTSTIARPYAKAVFSFAMQTKRLDEWSRYLHLIAEICTSQQLKRLLDEPSITRPQLAALIKDIGGKHLDDKAGNFINLLADNRRLALTADIFVMFEQLKDEQQRTMDVDIETYEEISSEQQASLKASLKQRLSREVSLNITLNKDLLGGAIIRAGDFFVIDGSVKGKLRKLATQLAV